MMKNGQKIHRIHYQEKEIILAGINYVSDESAETIKEILDREQPDTICLGLDTNRYYIISDPQGWKNTDIIHVLKGKKLLFLFIHLVLISFQRRIGEQFRVRTEEEIIETVVQTRKAGAGLILADRDIRITFRRLWNMVGLKAKILLMIELTVALFNHKPIPEEDLERLRREGVLMVVFKKFAKSFSQFKKVFIDERNQFLSQKIREAPGKKIIAIVGEEHIPGIKEAMNKEQDIQMLSKVPRRPRILLGFAFLIPVLLIGIIGTTFTISHSAGIRQMSSWILWNGILSSIGAAAGFAHPITVATAFFASPITSFLPLISISGVVLILEILLRRPTVGDFEKLAEGRFTVKGLWKNKVMRILLAAGLANVGSIVGSLLSSAHIIQLFMKVH